VLVWLSYLERGADLHTAQLMPLPLTASCFSKIRIGFTFLVPAHLGSSGQRAVKRVCVCVCVCVCFVLDGALHVFGWLSCVSAESAATRRVASDGSVCQQHSACVLNDVGLYVCRCNAGYVDIEGLCYRQYCICSVGWLGSRVVSVLDSGAEGPGLKSPSRRCRVTVLGKLFTPIVPLFTKQRNW